MDYCTILDVKRIAKSFSQDFDRQDPKFDAEIQEIITNSSALCASILQSRYSIAEIDSLDPFPNAVIRYTALFSAYTLYIQEGFVSGKDKDGAISQLQKMIATQRNILLYGDLHDASIQLRQSTTQFDPSINTEINNIYGERINGNDTE